MPRPGRYVSDLTAGMDNPDNLPPPILQKRSRVRKKCQCPHWVYRLYDRRCCCRTALQKLHRLRVRVRRYKWLSEVLKKIESPVLDRSLFFLEDKKLPSTSNSVERGNRRLRKMQKTVSRVRTAVHIRRRVALDMFRDLYLPLRRQTILTLHKERAV